MTLKLIYGQRFSLVLGIFRGSYVSVHVLLNLFNSLGKADKMLGLLNLLNKLGKKIRCETLPSILSALPNELNKFNNTGVRMQDSIYHMILKSHFISQLCTKTSRLRH